MEKVPSVVQFLIDEDGGQTAVMYRIRRKGPLISRQAFVEDWEGDLLASSYEVMQERVISRFDRERSPYTYFQGLPGEAEITFKIPKKGGDSDEQPELNEA